MSYSCLHFDAKAAMAHTSISAWNALMRSDPEFGRYALSEHGRSTFIAVFTVVEGNRWTVGGKLHRIGGPAVIRADLAMFVWYTRDCVEEWRERGQLHRADGPARTYANGTKKWYVNGKLHRIGGPAVMFANGGEEWREDDKLHRIGGPAVTHGSGHTEYWEHGVPADPRHANVVRWDS